MQIVHVNLGCHMHKKPNRFSACAFQSIFVHFACILYLDSLCYGSGWVAFALFLISSCSGFGMANRMVNPKINAVIKLCIHSHNCSLFLIAESKTQGKMTLKA